jgi:hypothetical protein
MVASATVTSRKCQKSMPGSTLVSTPRAAGLALAAGVFLFKLPLLGEGFGSDPDAWRAFAASAHLAATGEYIPSRLPGYPLPEYVGALFVSIGITTPMVFNLIAALLSAICALLIFRLVQAFGTGRALGAAALFSLVPVVVIAGTSNVDYLWGLAFFLGAALVLDARRIPMTALLLGLAAASRPTYALGIVPLLVMFLMQPPRTRGDKLVGMLTLVTISSAIAVAFFVPVLWRYRESFFAFPNAAIPWPVMLGNMSVRTFGVIGSPSRLRWWRLHGQGRS